MAPWKLDVKNVNSIVNRASALDRRAWTPGPLVRNCPARSVVRIFGPCFFCSGPGIVGRRTYGNAAPLEAGIREMRRSVLGRFSS